MTTVKVKAGRGRRSWSLVLEKFIELQAPIAEVTGIPANIDVANVRIAMRDVICRHREIDAAYSQIYVIERNATVYLINGAYTGEIRMLWE